MPLNTADHSLLKNLIESNGKTSSELYNKFFPKVLKYINIHDGDLQNAQDIFQSAIVLLILQARKKDFEIKSTLEGYFFTICKNLWRKEKKDTKSRVTNEGVLNLISEERSLALKALENDRWLLYKEKFEVLSENCKKVMQLSFEKVPYKKIATLLNYSSENTVRQRIFKCKTKLSELIKDDLRYNDLKEI